MIDYSIIGFGVVICNSSYGYKTHLVYCTSSKTSICSGMLRVQRPAINKHLKNIFEGGELQGESVSSILELTANDGKKYKTKFYNLDAIISVGYPVNSVQATHFRIWAAERLRGYIIKGFTMDDERLEDPEKIFGKDYFDDQLARIRDSYTKAHAYLPIYSLHYWL